MSAQPFFDFISKLRDAAVSNPLNTEVLTYNAALSKWKNATGGGGGGSGTVTSFSAGNLGPLFTTSVANPSTTPNLSFSLSTAGPHTFLGNNTGSTAAPGYVQPSFTDLSGSATDAQVPDVLTLTRISNLSTNGFVKTGSLNGTLSVDTTAYLTGNQTITISGDGSGSGTTAIPFTLTNIPDLTTQAGSILHTNIAAPTTPAAGKTKLYVDSTSKNIAAKNDAGTVNHGIQSRTATASNWIRSILDDGTSTISQPNFIDLSGTASTAQGALPAGGTANQVLSKNSGTNYDASWVDHLSTAVFQSVGTASPTGTTNTGGVMMGLAYGITPLRSGKVLLIVAGSIRNNTAGNGTSVGIRYGTGTAPGNGVALTGTFVVLLTGFSDTANSQLPFTAIGLATGLTLGTPIWFDLSVAVVGTGTASALNVGATAFELP